MQGFGKLKFTVQGLYLFGRSVYWSSLVPCSSKQHTQRVSGPPTRTSLSTEVCWIFLSGLISWLCCSKPRGGDVPWDSVACLRPIPLIFHWGEPGFYAEVMHLERHLGKPVPSLSLLTLSFRLMICCNILTRSIYGFKLKGSAGTSISEL